MDSFASKHQRLDLRLLQRVAAGDACCLQIDAFAFANQSQCQMRERSEIAARAHAALRRHKRSHTAIQHFAKRIDDDRAYAGITFRQRIGAQKHHGPGFRHGKWIADSDRVGAHQVDLQFANLIADNAHIAELSHASRDGVGQFVAGDDFVDDGSRPIDAARAPRLRAARDDVDPRLRAPLPE